VTRFSSRRSFALALALAVLLGCGGGEDTKAQEKQPPPDATKEGDKPAPKPDA
jgi:hypothetical protein